MIEIRNRWSNEVIYAHNVEGATMRDAVLAAVAGGSDLSDSNLIGSDLSDSNLSGSNLSGSDLSDSNLSGSNLRGSNLSGSNLSGSNLRGSNLRGSNLSDSNLSGSNLSGSNLRGSNLSGSNLRGSNLSDSNLSGSNLSGADLSPIRNDIISILCSAPREVPALIEALAAGRVDGSTYSGECSCLVGTIATARGVDAHSLTGGIMPDSSRPAERFFMGISKGDTPETNQVSALAHQWASEWLADMRAAFATA